MPIADDRVPFNRPYLTGGEESALADAHARGHLSGDGHYTRMCEDWLAAQTGARRAFLTPSCTAALELAALLLLLEPGDEVIMPSFTFVSTANAFALRGAVPVFVDVRADTLNIDERLVEAAITDRTRALCVVHYAGVAAEMDALLRIARRHGLAVVEDAAQGIMATYRGRPLGTLGDLGALSFHETKNLSSGEGGALLCRDDRHVARAEILRQKGTDRGRFSRGEVDRYTWMDVGSSYVPPEATAAFLALQMAEADRITTRRRALWARYHRWAEPYEQAGLLTRPSVPDGCQHNGHLYYVLLPSRASRDWMLHDLARQQVGAVFHFVPLHSSPAGLRYGRTPGPMPVTDSASERLLRLPMWVGLESRLDDVLAAASSSLDRLGARL